MARQPRFILPGHPQHIIQRGNNRQAIFHCNEDYEFYLEKLKESAAEQACEIHAYVQMTNHVHLLVTPLKVDSISKTMQTLGRYYVQYFNYKYQRTGTLWEGRYKSSLIDSEKYLLNCMIYIELNPVRAKMVACPSAYKWSSYHYNRLGKVDSLITPHEVYKNLGSTMAVQQLAYQQLFNSPLSKSLLNEISETANKCWVLGDKTFKESIQQLIKRCPGPKERGEIENRNYTEQKKLSKKV
jgi:putative transposase